MLPYCPVLGDVGDPYICRVAPYANRIHFEWLGNAGGEYEVFYRERDKGDFVPCGKVTGTECDITGLCEESEYEFFVTKGEKRSRVRLARCANPVGRNGERRGEGQHRGHALPSEDMETWTLVCDLLNGRELDIEKVGFQYADFEFEGDDIIFLCRTAWNGANSYHNSNYSTFHTIKNFRSL